MRCRVSEIWKGLTPEERLPFERKAEEDRIRYQLEKQSLEQASGIVAGEAAEGDNEVAEDVEDLHDEANGALSMYILSLSCYLYIFYLSLCTHLMPPSIYASIHSHKGR